jgi:RNA polymerase sigma-70 factor (ECF subfamily)
MEHHLDCWDWARLRRVCEREARRYFRSGADVDDVAQAAIERAWTHRDRCQNAAAPEGWVAQIARREALREHVRQRRDVLTDEPPETAVAPDDDAVLDRMVIGAALRHLHRGDRQLVTWRYADELSNREIGERLRIPDGAVRVRLHRARRALARQLGEEGVGRF